MNVNSLITKDYRKNDAFAVQKNKPNSNPIKPNLRKAKMNLNLTLTKDYRKNDCLAAQKTNPIQTQFLWIPAGVYPAQSLPRTSMWGCGDAGMRGRNNIFLPDVLFLVTMNRCFSENVIMTILSFWKNIEKTLVLRKKYGRK